jgi:hypothetical protein
VRVPKATAYTIWHSIHDQFRDNELHRAVYLEAEFRSLVQGDMDIATYTGRLKRLADALRDVGQPVQETSQVLNLLRGLSPKYRHTVPVISAKIPPHTFLSARSYLLLEEQYDAEHDKSAAQHALLAAGGSKPPAPASGANSAARSTTPHTGANTRGDSRIDNCGEHRGDNRGNRGRRRGRGNNTGGGSAHQGGFHGQRPPSSTWMPGLNPWTGMVQAWQMPFRVPGSGVLGPRPGAPPQQAYIAGPPHQQPSSAIPAQAPSSSDIWN